VRTPFVPVLGVVILALLAGWLIRPSLHAELSAEEQRKRELFLRARESIQPAPVATPTPAPVKPQARPRPTPPPVEKPSESITLPAPKVSTPVPTPREKPVPTPRSTPKSTPKPTPPREREKPAVPPVVADSPDDIVLPPARRETEPTPKPAPEEKESESIKLPPPQEDAPGDLVLPPPRPSASPTSTPAKESEVPPAPIVIEKSGADEDEGLAPTPKPERRGLFGLGGGRRYTYLTREVRAAIDRAPVKRGRWKYFIVHNSGTRQGNAKVFNSYHRNVRKMKNGLAYHFVIGNGTSSGDGEIEIGSRWTQQINGGHVASDFLNNIALGVCFVGDFNRDKPTPAQLAALQELIRYVRDRVGRSKGKVLIVKAHREINPKPTDCPGNRFPYTWLHKTFD
jgi:hypothetical protein